MNKNTINERRKTDTGTGVQMSRCPDVLSSYTISISQYSLCTYRLDYVAV